MGWGKARGMVDLISRSTMNSIYLSGKKNEKLETTENETEKVGNELLADFLPINW